MEKGRVVHRSFCGQGVQKPRRSRNQNAGSLVGFIALIQLLMSDGGYRMYNIHLTEQFDMSKGPKAQRYYVGRCMGYHMTENKSLQKLVSDISKSQ